MPESSTSVGAPAAARGAPAGRRRAPVVNRLTLRVAASLAVLVLLPALVLGAWVFQRARDDALRRALDEVASESADVAARIDEYVSVQRNAARWIASASEVSGFLAGPRRPRDAMALLEWIQTGPAFTADVSAGYLLDRDGVCLVSTDHRFVGESYAMRPYFQRAMLGEGYISDWTIGVTSGLPGIYLSAPVHGRGDDAGTVTGVLVVKLHTDPIEDAVQQPTGRGTHAFLANRQLVVLDHQDPRWRYRTLAEPAPGVREGINSTRQFADEPLDSLGLDTLAADVAATDRGTTSVTRPYEVDGQDRVAALAGLESEPWVVVAEIPSREVLESVDQLAWAAMVVAGLLVLYAVIASAYLSRTVVRPLRDLVRTSGALASGDLDARVRVHGDDEVGQLARAFNQMADTIRGNTERLESEVARRTAELEEANRVVTALSVTDSLTGCFNRLYLDRELVEAVRRARLTDQPLSVVLIDLDRFKQINDGSGHSAGDEVLRAVGAYLRGQPSRDGAWAARYGGEEFVVVLPATPLAEAAARAEAMRAGIAELSVDLTTTVTASMGVAQAEVDPVALDGETIDALLRRCDLALYRAKAAGRNRVVVDGSPVASGRIRPGVV